MPVRLSPDSFPTLRKLTSECSQISSKIFKCTPAQAEKVLARIGQEIVQDIILKQIRTCKTCRTSSKFGMIAPQESPPDTPPEQIVLELVRVTNVKESVIHLIVRYCFIIIGAIFLAWFLSWSVPTGRIITAHSRFKDSINNADFPENITDVQELIKQGGYPSFLWPECNRGCARQTAINNHFIKSLRAIGKHFGSNDVNILVNPDFSINTSSLGRALKDALTFGLSDGYAHGEIQAFSGQVWLHVRGFVWGFGAYMSAIVMMFGRRPWETLNPRRQTRRERVPIDVKVPLLLAQELEPLLRPRLLMMGKKKTRVKPTNLLKFGARTKTVTRKDRKVYIGKRGGKYYVSKGKKVYLKSP